MKCYDFRKRNIFNERRAFCETKNSSFVDSVYDHFLIFDGITIWKYESLSRRNNGGEHICASGYFTYQRKY